MKGDDDTEAWVTSPNTGSFSGSDLLASGLLPELRRIAKAKMRSERPNHTLQPTELVNELYIRLLRRPDFTWRDREHFLLSASHAMRHFLIDYARERRAAKRGGEFVRLELTETAGIFAPNPDLILDVDVALNRLARTEPRMAQVVELRFFGGLTFEEIGKVLGINERTAKRDWTLARGWLGNNLGRMESDECGRVGEN